MSMGMFSELNSSPGSLWLLNLLLCFCGFSSLLFAVAGCAVSSSIRFGQMVAKNTASSWMTCYNLYSSHPALCYGCSLFLGAASPGSCNINCTPLLSLLLGLVLNWQLAFSHLFTLMLFCHVLLVWETWIRWKWQGHPCPGDSCLCFASWDTQAV